MKKMNLMWVLVFLLFVSLISAEEGCYIYGDSMLYCLDLEREEALGDCMTYDGCRFENVFFEGKSCTDFNMFSECKEIFCKSTCDYEPLGKCEGGEVPSKEERAWCSLGCCQFEYYGEIFCGFKKNKWLCEIEARNKNAEKFSFEAIGERECLAVCKEPSLLGEKVTEKTEMGEISSSEPVDWGKGISRFLIFLFLVLLIVIFFLLYRRYKPGERRDSVKMIRKPFFLIKKSIKEREWRIGKIKEEREQKRKEKERRDLFELFDLGEIKERKLSHVDLLEKVAKVHELKDRRRIREEDIFGKVKRLFKEREKNELEKQTTTEGEVKDVFERLKKVIKRK